MKKFFLIVIYGLALILGAYGSYHDHKGNANAYQRSSIIFAMDGAKRQIDDLGDFFKVYIRLQISIVILTFLCSILLGNFGYIVSVVAHFIWVISERDYGFFNVLLLFSIASIISFLLRTILVLRKNKN